VRNALNAVVQAVGGAVNAAISIVRNMIKGLNAVRGALGLAPLALPDFVKIPAFARGGFVERPTVGLVGEAGREYIVPEKKMATVSANYLSGARGKQAFMSTGSRMASVGFLGGLRNAPGTRAAGVGFIAGAERQLGGISINLTLSGPTVQMGGQNYVTVDQFRQGISEAVGQSVRAMSGEIRNNPGLRQQVRTR
jgi:hypothetical protein